MNNIIYPDNFSQYVMGEEYHALMNYKAGYEYRTQTEFFNDAWERSEPLSETQHLFI